jgi:hypothetical protein
VKKVKTSLFLAVAALYCFILGFSGNSASAGNTFSDAGKGSVECVSISSANLLCPPAPAERTVTVHTHAPSSSLKNPFSEFTACLSATQQLFIVAFSQRYYSQQVWVRLQKADLIFPFHSFW